MSAFIGPAMGIGAAAAAGAKKKTGNESVYGVDANKYGSAYSSVVGANPYANMDYRQSFWQKVLEGLGFRTNYDAYKESMALQAKEYDAQMAQKAYNEHYDSALDQTQRLREAGINPDIVGDVDAGASQGPVDDGNPPVPPQADDFGMVSQGLQSLGAMAVNSVQMALGFAKDFQSLRQMRIDSNTRLMDFAHDAVNSLIEEDYENFNGDSVDTLHKLEQTYGEALPRKDMKKFLGYAMRYTASLSRWADEMKSRNEATENRQEYFERISNEDRYSPIDSIMQTISKDYSKIVYDTWKSMQYRDRSKADFEKQEAEFNAKALESASPELEGKAQNARNDYEIFHTELQKNLKQGFDKILGDLNAAAQKGNWLAGIVSMIMSGFMMRYIGM